MIIAVAFVTVALGVTARTAFSLMFPPIVDEFGWDRGLAAGAFSFGFLVSAVISPIIGRLMDRRGPRFVIEIGVLITAAGLIGATLIAAPWQLYATLGLLVGTGANCMSYSVHSQFLPNWFVRRRALAIGIAFSGVGAGAILILPWLQAMILQRGLAHRLLGARADHPGRAAADQPAGQPRAPRSSACCPTASRTPAGAARRKRRRTSSTPQWAAIDWTVPRAIRTARFWWLALSFFCGGYIWYAVQVHQTKYLVEIGFNADAGGVVARHRRDGRHPGPDRARRAVATASAARSCGR